MRALVTGAASGIGRAVAERLARDGMARDGAPPGATTPGATTIVVADLDTARLADTVARVRATGAHAVALAGDLAQADVPGHLVEQAVAAAGGLDALVSNAGIVLPGALLDLDVATWDRTFAINTRATWLLAKAAHAALRDSRGALVVTGSISASQATATLGAYSSSKAALLLLVRQLADEWGGDGIRCNMVSPGAVHTALTERVYGDPAIRAAREAKLPLRRVAQPEDIANAIAFLAGPDAAYITGADLAVDGGMPHAFMRLSRGDVRL